MATISKSIEIGAEASKIHSQCIREFPDYIKGLKKVRAVRPIPHNCLSWEAKTPGQEWEWEVQIEEQVPNRRISWRCSIGAYNSGSVELAKLNENRMRFGLILTTPHSSPEQVNLLTARVQGELEGAGGNWRGRRSESRRKNPADTMLRLSKKRSGALKTSPRFTRP